ncbi:TlyA family RNA methyltransferase [Malacoplasma penetrans]|uniref:Hemolysin n=1 Tax=Malacoplasma penetrans (strain HF-2) TaxID=272633 RepID=Q8EWQ3_MALP2|nr:TlyA family rRNA (cytidine-2'-O)-methyltransferase [Malacoplasma penetrans]RXY96996.1 TlyA family RNA methyltransferase [Malacoplasma penetrans]BAC43941.1 hemolysin [Malacoplasma penetrans HF-2]
MQKIRLDIYLVNENYARSRGVAQDLITNSKVVINGQIISKSNTLVNELDKVEILEEEKYVSRAAYKLKAAIEHFNIDLNNKIAIDIGSSTGGFTQVLLENNVKKVYSIDVGTNQLNEQLKKNNKVISLEQTNFREIESSLIKDKIDFITIDVSFISINLIFNKIKELKWNNWKSIALLKPQFELGKKIGTTKGFAKTEDHKKIINNFIEFLSILNIKNLGYIVSPIKGAKKENTEYLFYLEYKNEK